MAGSTAGWWDTPNYTPFGRQTITFANGQPDIEKGDVFGLPAGTPITLPVAGRVAWAGRYQAVVQLPSGGFLNFLHLDTAVQAGQQLQPGAVLGTVGREKGHYTDPSTGHWYESPGNALEVGLYDSLARAVARDNPNPRDLTGISDPTPLFRGWDSALGGFAPGYTGISTPVSTPASQGGLPPATEPSPGSTTVGKANSGGPMPGTSGGTIPGSTGVQGPSNPFDGLAGALGSLGSGLTSWAGRALLTGGLAIGGLVFVLFAVRHTAQDVITGA